MNMGVKTQRRVLFLHLLIPKTVLALEVLTVLLRALERYLDPVALPGSIFPCNLQYLVIPTLKTHTVKLTN